MIGGTPVVSEGAGLSGEVPEDISTAPRMLPRSTECRELTIEAGCAVVVTVLIDAVDLGDTTAKCMGELRDSGRVPAGLSSISLAGQEKTTRTTNPPMLNGIKSRSKFVVTTLEGIVSVSSNKRLRALRIRKSVIIFAWCLHPRHAGVIEVITRTTT
jgi:hypothetical protein